MAEYNNPKTNAGIFEDGKQEIQLRCASCGQWFLTHALHIDGKCHHPIGDGNKILPYCGKC